MATLTQQGDVPLTNRLLVSMTVAFLTVASSLASAREISITNERLEVSLALPEGLLTVRDRESDVQWRQFLPTKHVLRGRSWDRVRVTPVAPDRLIRIDQAEAQGNVIHAKATWRGEPFTIRYALLDDRNRLRVTVDSPNRAQPLPWKPDWMGGKLMTYPYAFCSQDAAPYSVVPMDEGLIFSTRETDIRTDPVRWHYAWLHRQLSMPWYGVTDLDRGVMTRIDTPFDCMFSIQWVDTPWGERTLPQLTWVASKGAVSYERSVTFRFASRGGYTAMAKAFRQEMMDCGQLRSWEDKIRDNPAVARLRGALDLWYRGKITLELISQLRESGIRRAIVSRSSGGDPKPGDGIEPDGLDAAKKAGFLVGMYHNYTWIQGRWVEADPSLADLAALPASGELRYRSNGFDPKGNLMRCPATHGVAFSKISKAERDLGLNYFFTDCTTAGGSIIDCYHPDHPVSRRDAARELRFALDNVSGLGLVVGSERGTWWATPSVHVFEGIETILVYAGPYRGAGGESHWVGPYFKDKPGYEEVFLGVEFNPARHVPLFQLVYHDSVYCTRRWNQDPLRAPELWTRHDLMNINNGTSSLWMMRDGAKNMIGTADWEKVKDRYLQTYRDVCGWHEKIGFDEMLEHRFFSDDRLVQQSRFSSGWTVVVNFSDAPWKDARGFSVAAHSHYSFHE